MGDTADYSDQPKPIEVKDAVSAHDLVIEDLNRIFGHVPGCEDAIDFVQGRKDFGLKKYGVPLHKDNGRDYTKDITDEIGDLVAYFRVFMSRSKQLEYRLDNDYFNLLSFFVRFMGSIEELKDLERS